MGEKCEKEGTSSSSLNWGQYLNLSSDKEGDLEPSTSSTWSGSWIEKWFFPEVSSSAPNDQGPRQQGEGALFQPTDTHQEQPPAAGPSEPRRDLSHVPPGSSPLFSLSDQEVLKQFFWEEGAAVEQQEQPGGPEALPLAPAPAEDRELITKSIIRLMKQLYPNDPWDPENPLIRGERIIPGGKGKKNLRPMTIKELQSIFDRLEREGKKSYWAKELHRRIDTWTWQNPRGPS